VAEFGAGKVTALRAADTSCWETLPSPLPQAVLDAAGTVAGGVLYVISGKTEGGYVSSVYAFDPQTNIWLTLADKPGLPVENAAAVTISGQIYVFGGSTAPFSGALGDSWRYDPSSDEWSSNAPMPTPRGGARAEVVDGLVYVIGGMGADGASLATVEVYDPVANSWSAGPSLLQERDNRGSAVVNGKIFVFGGGHRASSGLVLQENLSSAEVYDPILASWSSFSPMNVGRRTMSVGVLDGKILAVGGEADPLSIDGVFHVVERYDHLSDTWTRLSDVENARQGAAYGTIDGRLYVVGGGLTKGTAFTDILEVY
jgi:N-acetylneuraminic acid mutarotase